MQTVLKKLMRSKKATLLSSQIIPTPKDEVFKRLTIRMQMKVSPKNLQSILYILETHKPYLFVDNLSVQPLKPPRGSDTPIRQELNVEMDVFGYLKGEAKSNDA